MSITPAPDISVFFDNKIAELTAFKEWYLRKAKEDADYDAELLDGSGFEEMFDDFRDGR